MKLRKRDRNTSSASTSSSSASANDTTTSTASTSFVGSNPSGSTNRAGKRQPAIRGRSRATKKILKEKNDPPEVEENKDDKSIDIDTMADIFQKCQHLQYHDDCIKKLREIYHATSHRDFCEKLAHFIKIILRSEVKSPFTKNCLSFIPKLINTLDNEKRGIELKEDETMDELAESIFGEEIFTSTRISKECVQDYVLSEVLVRELQSVNTKVRQNSCSLVNRLLHGTLDIDDNIYQSLRGILLNLQCDRNYLVRALASFTLTVFQEPTQASCPVIKCYLFHLLKDPAFQVRVAVLRSIQVTPGTLHFIIKKIRDVKAVVRKLAYIKIADDVSLKSLSSVQRLHILKEGFNDRHPNVRKIVEDKLLSSWLKQCDGDLVKLIAEIDVKTDPKTAKKVLNIFANQFIDLAEEQFGTKFHALAHDFRECYLDGEKLLMSEHENPEKVFIWQCLNSFIKTNEDKFIKRADKNFAAKASDQLNNSTLVGNADKAGGTENVLDDWANQTLNEDFNQGKDDSHIADYLFPELPHICQYLQKFVDSIDSLVEPSVEELADKEFVYNQLVSLLLLYDVCDEAQQNYILEMIRTIIFSPNLHIDFRDSISPIMKFIARKIFKDPNHLIEFTAECTSKVYNIAAEISAEESVDKAKTPEPSSSVEPTLDTDYARLTVEIEEYRDQLDKAIAEQDFMTAQTMKNKLDELTSERERFQNIRLQQKTTQSQPIPQSQVPPTQPFNLNDHPETLLKCLQIFVGALEHGKFETANPLIFSHVDQIVLPSVINRDVRTRLIAVKALGLSCLLSDSLFRQRCNLILQVSKFDSDVNIRVISLHSIFDCICKHGIEPLLKKAKATPEERRTSRRRIEEDIANLTLQAEDPDMLDFSQMESIGDAETVADLQRSMMMEEGIDNEDEDEDAETTIVERERSCYFETLDNNSEQDMINSLIKLFTETLLFSGFEEVEETAVEGFAKLMILGVIYSPSLLSRLIIIWYLPETRPKVLQFLGMFLPIYVGSESKYVREDDHITVTGQTCLIDCFIDTLEIIYEAKYCLDKDPEDIRLFQYLPSLDENSRYKEIDLKNVNNFMLNLVKPTHHKHLLSNLIHKMYSIVISNDREFKFYEDFLCEYLLKACQRLSLDDIDDTVFNELRPVMIKLIVKIKSRLEDMRTASRKKAEQFIKAFLVFYKSLGRGDLNASLSHASAGDASGDPIEGADELEQMEEDLNLDPLGSMPDLSDEELLKENNAVEGEEEKPVGPDDDEEEEEIVGGDDDDELNGDLDSLSDVSATLRWSDIEDNET